MKLTKIYGTTSARGYRTLRHGWLSPPAPFLAPNSVRGWAFGGSAERPSTLKILTGEELIPSWDRCAQAIVAFAARAPRGVPSTWVDEYDISCLERLGAPGPRVPCNDASAATVAWVLEHILGPWRTREAMRLYRGWSDREAGLDTEPGCIRSPEDLIAACNSSHFELRFERFGAALLVNLAC